MQTPHQRYTAIPKALEPTPRTSPAPVPTKPKLHTRKADSSGIISIAYMRIQVGHENAGHTFNIIVEPTIIHIFDTHGTLLATHPKAARGTYIGNGKPRGFLATQPVKPHPSATS